MRWGSRNLTRGGPVTVDDRRQVAAWSLYNWANHGWAAPVSAVLIGPWMLALATHAVGKHGRLISLGPLHLQAVAYPSAMLSVAAVLQFFLLPMVGAAADVHHAKRRWLGAACISGSAVCGALAMTGGSEWLLAGLLFLAGSVIEGTSNLVWNGMLPEIAEPGRRDAVSGQGTSIGYLGAGILLALELAFTDAHQVVGLSKASAVRVCFLLAGIWWSGFGLVALRRLNPPSRLLSSQGGPRPPGTDATRAGAIVAQLRAGYRLLNGMPQALRFVIAYLCFGDAVSAVISLSSTFLTHQLFNDNTNEASTFLFALILLVQFVAIGGALLFARVARRTGTKRALLINLVIWFLVIVFAYAILDTQAEAVVMGVAIGLALGGATALARSMFAQMIPAGTEATFFALFEVCSQGTSWLAPLLFTIVVNITGSFRQAILSLISLFAVGFVLLWRVDVDQDPRPGTRAPPVPTQPPAPRH